MTRMLARAFSRTVQSYRHAPSHGLVRRNCLRDDLPDRGVELVLRLAVTAWRGFREPEPHCLKETDFTRFAEHISTSHVERSNLTIRMSTRRYTRLTNAHSKKLENHACDVAMFFTFYSFCRVHSTIGTSPAVASGLTDHVWTLEELLGLLD